MAKDDSLFWLTDHTCHVKSHYPRTLVLFIKANFANKFAHRIFVIIWWFDMNPSNPVRSKLLSTIFFSFQSIVIGTSKSPCVDEIKRLEEKPASEDVLDPGVRTDPTLHTQNPSTVPLLSQNRMTSEECLVFRNSEPSCFWLSASQPNILFQFRVTHL